MVNSDRKAKRRYLIIVTSAQEEGRQFKCSKYTER